MPIIDVREEAKRIVDKMPVNSTWDDVMHEIYVRQCIERGLSDSQQGKVHEVAEVRKRLGLHQ